MKITIDRKPVDFIYVSTTPVVIPYHPSVEFDGDKEWLNRWQVDAYDRNNNKIIVNEESGICHTNFDLFVEVFLSMIFIDTLVIIPLFLITYFTSLISILLLIPLIVLNIIIFRKGFIKPKNEMKELIQKYKEGKINRIIQIIKDDNYPGLHYYSH